MTCQDPGAGRHRIDIGRGEKGHASMFGVEIEQMSSVLLAEGAEEANGVLCVACRILQARNMHGTRSGSQPTSHVPYVRRRKPSARSCTSARADRHRAA